MSARRQEPGALFSRFPFPSFFARLPLFFFPYPSFPTLPSPTLSSFPPSSIPLPTPPDSQWKLADSELCCFAVSFLGAYKYICVLTPILPTRPNDNETIGKTTHHHPQTLSCQQLIHKDVLAAQLQNTNYQLPSAWLLLENSSVSKRGSGRHCQHW
jgi:hypothetical protein